jgi:uncharacterized membrane protein YczE
MNTKNKPKPVYFGSALISLALGIAIIIRASYGITVPWKQWWEPWVTPGQLHVEGIIWIIISACLFWCSLKHTLFDKTGNTETKK